MTAVESADPFGGIEPWTVDWTVTGPFRNWRGRTFWRWSLDEPRQGWVQMNRWSRTIEGRASTQNRAVAAAQVAAFNLAHSLNFPDSTVALHGSETGL